MKTEIFSTIKKSIIGGVVFSLTVAGIAYAASITSVGQTVSSGDTIEAAWFNDVNDQLEINLYRSSEFENCGVENNLGVHKFCSIGKYHKRGIGNAAFHCSVYKSGGNWYLKNSCSGYQGSCIANCF